MVPIIIMMMMMLLLMMSSHHLCSSVSAFVTMQAEGCENPVECGAKQNPAWEYPQDSQLHNLSKHGPYETRSIYHTYKRNVDAHSPTGVENIALRVGELLTTAGGQLTGGQLSDFSTTLVTYPVRIKYRYDPVYETRFDFLRGFAPYQHQVSSKRSVDRWEIPGDLPVVAYARGAGGQVLDRKESYDHLASHGMVVTASLNPMFTANSLADEQVWDLLEFDRIAREEEITNSSSKTSRLLHGKLKRGAWGTAGYSLGGASAVVASQMLPCGPDLRHGPTPLQREIIQRLATNTTTTEEEEPSLGGMSTSTRIHHQKQNLPGCIRAVAAFHSGTPIIGAYVMSGRGGLPGDAVRAPVLYTAGALDPLMSSSLTQQYAPAKTPKLMLVGQMGDHFEPFGRYGASTTAWFLAYLKDDKSAKNALWGADGDTSKAMQRASSLASPLFASVMRSNQCTFCEEIVNRTRFAPVWDLIVEEEEEARLQMEKEMEEEMEKARLERVEREEEELAARLAMMMMSPVMDSQLDFELEDEGNRRPPAAFMGPGGLFRRVFQGGGGPPSPPPGRSAARSALGTILTNRVEYEASYQQWLRDERSSAAAATTSSSMSPLAG